LGSFSYCVFRKSPCQSSDRGGTNWKDTPNKRSNSEEYIVSSLEMSTSHSYLSSTKNYFSNVGEQRTCLFDKTNPNRVLLELPVETGAVNYIYVILICIIPALIIIPTIIWLIVFV
jgi:hypothetical protein